MKLTAKQLQRLQRAKTRRAEIMSIVTQRYKLECLSVRERHWNETIDWLDTNHPGWRGYEVQYVNGKVA